MSQNVIFLKLHLQHENSVIADCHYHNRLCDAVTLQKNALSMILTWMRRMCIIPSQGLLLHDNAWKLRTSSKRNYVFTDTVNVHPLPSLSFKNHFTRIRKSQKIGFCCYCLKRLKGDAMKYEIYRSQGCFGLVRIWLNIITSLYRLPKEKDYCNRLSSSPTIHHSLFCKGLSHHRMTIIFGKYTKMCHHIKSLLFYNNFTTGICFPNVTYSLLWSIIQNRTT